MARARILVVEDDESQQALYEAFFDSLYKDEFMWVLAKNGTEAFAQLKKHPSPPIDAAILDWRLPDTDGLAMLRHIRSNPSTRNILVFMVTGNADQRNTDSALESGADEYFTKPFRENQLYLKLRNQLQRRWMAQEERGVFELDGLKLNLKDQGVLLDGHPVHLKPKEFDLLMVLLERSDIVHAQSYLAEAISLPSEETSPEAVRQHVYGLHKALGPWGDRIEARYGQGYVLHTKSPVS